MKIRAFENLILKQLKKVIDQIIQENAVLSISAKARAGAEISNWLEDQFVEYTRNHEYFKDSQSAPKENPKHPWDVKTTFTLNSVREEISIDFKAFKITSANSNPDIGTPNKIFDLIKAGKFYHTFIYLFYQSSDTGLEFVEQVDGFARLYFLKDINSSFRRNPKNQLQVNITKLPEYRTREAFIQLLIHKIKESHERQIEISSKALKNLENEKTRLLKANAESEAQLIKKI